jgi:hypothetical protein
LFGFHVKLRILWRPTFTVLQTTVTGLKPVLAVITVCSLDSVTNSPWPLPPKTLPVPCSSPVKSLYFKAFSAIPTTNKSW